MKQESDECVEISLLEATVATRLTEHRRELAKRHDSLLGYSQVFLFRDPKIQPT